MARLRAALAHVGLRLKTQALTLHVHPTCTKEDVPHLDLAFAAALLTLSGRLQSQDLLHTAHAGTLTLAGDLHGPSLGPSTGLSTLGPVAPPEIQRLIHVQGGDRFLPDNHGHERRWEVSHLAQLVNFMPSWQDFNASLSPNPKKDPALPRNLHWEEIQGEGHAKTWLAIAAKHRLPVLMSGPPGCGKTSLAKTCVALRARRLRKPNVPWVAPHPAGGVAGLLGLGGVAHLGLAPGPKPMAACSSWTSFWNGPDPPASRCVMSWKPTAWNCTGQRALRFGCPNPGSWPPPTPAPADEATNNVCARRRSRNCTAGNARRLCSSASPFNSMSDTIHGRASSRGKMSSNGLVAPSPLRAFHGRAVSARVG